MKKRVLICHFDLCGGGAEKVLINLLNHIDHSKYDITLFTLFKTGCNVDQVPANVTFKYLFKRQFRGFNTIMKFLSPGLLHKLLIRDDYDIEIAYLETSPTRIISGCRDKSTKKVAFIHISVEDRAQFVSAFRGVKEAVKSFNNLDSIVFVSNTAMQSFIQAFPEVLTDKRVLYNINDIDQIKALSTEATPQNFKNKEVLNIITIGRFVEQKGYERLLRVVGRLRRHGLANHLHIYILGTGALESSYKEIINKEDIADCATLLGYQSNPYKFLAKSDLFICSSYSEGFSTVATESIILGVPVLTTDCSGMNELLLGGKLGMIVANREEAIFNGLVKIIENKSTLQRYREAIKVNNRYSRTQDYVDKYEEFIDTL